ncbi:MAG: PD-(D/E)XK nuclease family protein, partial [Gemmatimonadota bacterium]|nr:PD-(D/E)XK nuclease family protein [Gemmatimonadota bacterium]
LAELLILLGAIADPDNAVAVIAALEGWCFGCSHQDLWDAREQRTKFGISQQPVVAGSTVGVALMQLHSWWLHSRRITAASLVEKILDESGLLVLAASDDLGDRSAGHLLQLVAMLRRGNVATDVSSAIDAIESTLGRDDDDASLHAGQGNAVRVMNLHKAKGLEAPVVILAAPVAPKKFEPSIAHWRDTRGNAQGALLVTNGTNVIAQPADWDVRAATELEREREEHDRLLYVAVTRARDELVVARRAPYELAKGDQRGDESRWSPLARVLDAQSTRIEVANTAPHGRKTVVDSAAQISERIEAARQARVSSGKAHYSIATVTEAAKRTAALAAEHGIAFAFELRDAVSPVEVSADEQPGDDQLVLGSLVHQAIEGALRGRNSEQLERFVRAQLWHAVSDVGTNAEALTQRVLAAVRQAIATTEWAELARALPRPLAELGIAHVTDDDGTRVLAEGIVDLAGTVNNEWIVVDWKNSSSSDSAWLRMLPAYQLQVDAYASALKARTGQNARGSIVRLTDTK